MTDSSSKYCIGFAAVLALVVLRMAVGWHFLKSGLEKYTDDNFSSAGFLSQAKGPLAGWHRGMIPDFHGYRAAVDELLDADGPAATDIRTLLKEKDNPLEKWQATVVRDWGQYRVDADGHYGFDEVQRAEAVRVLETYEQKLGESVDELKDWLATNPDKVRSLIRHRRSPTAEEVPYEQGRVTAAAAEVNGQTAKLHAEAKALERDYRVMLVNRALAVVDESKENDPAKRAERLAEQRAKDPMPEPTTGLEKFDRVLTYCLLAGGICLLVGLFTRLAAAGGLFFLLNVMGTQDMWLSGSHSVLMLFELVELGALVVLIAIPTGRWLGLDYFISHCCSRCCGRQSAKQHG